MGRYRFLLTRGILWEYGMQVASVPVVMTFILAQQGLAWAAGMLFPVFNAGAVIGSALAPGFLERSHQKRNVSLAGTAFIIAALIALIAVSARTNASTALVFLCLSAAIGVVLTIADVIFSQIISDTLTPARGRNLILVQGAIGSAMTIVTVLIALPWIADRDPAHGHADLLWLGAVGVAAAGLTAIFVGQPKRIAVPRRRLRDTYRDGISAVRSERWFRTYIVAQFFFIPVLLSTTFLTIHASGQLGDRAGSLHFLVIVVGVGWIVAAPLQHVIGRRFGTRGMLVTSALLCMAAAAISVVAGVFHAWSHPLVHGIAIGFSVIAGQGAWVAIFAWLSYFSTDKDRGALTGFASILIAIESATIGAALGAIAHNIHAVWPVAVVLTLSFAAAVVALSTPDVAAQEQRGEPVDAYQRSCRTEDNRHNRGSASIRREPIVGSGGPGRSNL